MKFETEEPTHRALPPLGYAFEYLVNMNALVPANAQRGAVHKTDAGTFAKKNLLDEQCQRKSHLSLAQQIDCTRQPVGTAGEGVCRLYPNRNALGNGEIGASPPTWRR
jgi:hypothetical protein